MADWSTIASVGTAAGTLVLALATFASVRSSNRSAKVSEKAMLAGIRPVMVTSRLDDPYEKVGFQDNHWMRVEGGRGVVEIVDGTIYLGLAVRNVGNGLAVLDRWNIHVGRQSDDPLGELDDFRRLTRDIYIAAGDHGFWQGSIRDISDPMFLPVSNAVAEGEMIVIDVLYGDHDGGQHTISRFALIARPEGQRIAAVSRHWNLDRSDPR